MSEETKTEAKAEEAAPEAPKAPAKETGKAAADLAKGAMNNAGGLMQEFKEFISKGNVMDLAVGMIVGSAFTAIVTSLVDDILMPIIGTVLVGINFHDLGIRIPWGSNPYIDLGGFVQHVVTFLLTAACLFIIIKTLNAFKRKEEAKPAEPPKPSNEEVLLTEIRDLLKEKK